MSRTPRSTNSLSRREAIGTAAAVLGSTLVPHGWAAPVESSYRLATFVAEVTPPLGHPCMGGGIAPVKEIIDPLFVHGFVLLGVGKPIVLAAVDWCEIRNDAYEGWRNALAEA